MENLILRPRVYAIDDNPADLVMARLLLNKEGCEPILFEDQIKAFKSLQRDIPHLILLDIEMPGISGIEILRRIRHVKKLQNVPVIMVTGKSDIVDVKRAISSGANDYIVKPLDPEIFELKLWRLLKEFNKKDHLKQDWVEYMLEKTASQDAHLQVDAKVLTIGESSLTIQTDSPLPLNFNFYIILPFLKELDIPLLPLSILSCDEAGDHYHSKCNVIGLKEKELQKIRLFCKSLWRNQKYGG